MKQTGSALLNLCSILPGTHLCNIHKHRLPLLTLPGANYFKSTKEVSAHHSQNRAYLFKGGLSGLGRS